VSDKNQGIPLDVALATTLKSEVLKACRKLPAGFDKVCFSGRIFRWRFARECAEDFVRAEGVRDVIWDPDNDHVLDALTAAGREAITEGERDPPAANPATTLPRTFPGFPVIKAQHEASGVYLRLPSAPLPAWSPSELMSRPVVIGLDVGSTMAKVVVADGEDGDVLFRSTFSNAGDTIETIKRVLRDLLARGVSRLRVRGIGVTGSARYQVQQALARIYPTLADRLTVLVENYAHARGSIDEARRHVARLSERGVAVNRDFCVLVDIGGEDTKISTIALAQAELYANAMNLKCSAGTGSLMDALSALFGLPGVDTACAQAFAAPQSFEINATCAVFLMENARRLQAQGVPRDQILASANWAIVENMARTLWGQIELPRRAVVLLHGQTMLSEPLPLAVTDRLQSYQDAPAYALVPPDPGHRACIGLVRTLVQEAPAGTTDVALDALVSAVFDKRVIQCHGTACGDDAARCNRTSLACTGADGQRFTFALGGCSAINERSGRRGAVALPAARDAYKEIWDFIASRHPHSEAANRLVIPRSFCVSEWAFLFARLFERFGIPVHVDEVRDSDLIAAQSVFHVDTCAPHMGAVGQYRRLAAEPHGVILAPQIENLPTTEAVLGLTCTVNQGGVAVAHNLAATEHPEARFHVFSIQLAQLDAAALADQLGPRLTDVFAHYGHAPSADALRDALAGAIDDHRALRLAAADLAADFAEEARAEGRQVAVVVGREYVLNPGLYDSSVRRLLRDKRMAAIPSYVLEVDPDPEFARVYWRNPRVILSMLKAIADKTLHRCLKHPRLAAVFREIEAAAETGALLPVVQVSTFCCGPDSVTAHLVSEIMCRRPFLLLQSDAMLKELAHLENRINTYVKQLELGLHGALKVDDGPPIEVAHIDSLRSRDPVDPARDVIYVPTLGDNRALTSVLRAAGFSCLDNHDEARPLSALVRDGRRYTGDAVCAPLAAVYGDLMAAVEDFRRRHEQGDPLVAGKRRLLYFDVQGDGPCRQGQYADVHQFMARREIGDAPIAGNAMLQVLVGRETDGYNIGVAEWALFRAYQGLVVQALLQELLFAGGSRCPDAGEYERFQQAHRELKNEIYGVLESFRGPGAIGRRVVAATGKIPGLGVGAKFVAYRLHGRDLARPLARFARTWIHGRSLDPDHLHLHASGEAYMRSAQAEDLFGKLLRLSGFRRFDLTLAPLWAYLEYLPEYEVECSHETLATLHETRARAHDPRERRDADTAMIAEQRKVRQSRRIGWLVRHVMARPLYRAAGVPLPPSPRRLLDEAREILPTLRPHGELALYVGEALMALRAGADIFFNLAPAGCMVASMGSVLTPRIQQVAGAADGRIQSLFSADGDIDEELLALAVLKARGPHTGVDPAGCGQRHSQLSEDTGAGLDGVPGSIGRALPCND
jgi:activator of 2-hydroxyglutaryl-CoA dehydratase/predicted nucleotide-binding protein (sugar kinase/HSP70/actin superfamily)